VSWEKCQKNEKDVSHLFCLNVALNLKSPYIPVIIPTPWPCQRVGIYKYTKSLAGNLVGWNWSEGHFQKLLEVQAFMKCLFILIFCSFCCCLTLVVCICLSEYNLHGCQEFFDGCLIIRCLWFGEYQLNFFYKYKVIWADTFTSAEVLACLKSTVTVPIVLSKGYL